MRHCEVVFANQTRSKPSGHKVQNSRVQKRSRRLTKRFLKALSYATKLHADQTRKGTDEPYIGHLLGVASLVLQPGGKEDEAIAALLHDAMDRAQRPRFILFFSCFAQESAAARRSVIPLIP
jgi:(p)ppGpp synthase/HD superfamily hydrolase